MFLRNLYQQKHCRLGLKGEYKREEDCQFPKFYSQETHWLNNSIAKYLLRSQKRKEGPQGRAMSLEGRDMNPKVGAANRRIIPGAQNYRPGLDAWDKRWDLVLWEDLEGAGGEGGGRGIGMGKTCEPKAFSFQCMTEFTTNKKIN